MEGGGELYLQISNVPLSGTIKQSLTSGVLFKVSWGFKKPYTAKPGTTAP